MVLCSTHLEGVLSRLARRCVCLLACTAGRPARADTLRGLFRVTVPATAPARAGGGQVSDLAVTLEVEETAELEPSLRDQTGQGADARCGPKGARRHLARARESRWRSSSQTWPGPGAGASAREREFRRTLRTRRSGGVGVRSGAQGFAVGRGAGQLDGGAPACRRACSTPETAPTPPTRAQHLAPRLVGGESTGWPHSAGLPAGTAGGGTLRASAAPAGRGSLGAGGCGRLRVRVSAHAWPGPLTLAKHRVEGYVGVAPLVRTPSDSGSWWCGALIFSLRCRQHGGQPGGRVRPHGAGGRLCAGGPALVTHLGALAGWAHGRRAERWCGRVAEGARARLPPRGHVRRRGDPVARAAVGHV